METLQVIFHGHINPSEVDLNDNYDTEFKPGIYRQTKSFMQRDYSRLCSITDQVNQSLIFSQIAGYPVSENTSY